MKYLNLLQCEQFRIDFASHFTCKTTGITIVDEDDFILNDDDLLIKLIEFFTAEFDISIIEINDYPKSYNVYTKHSQSEYFCCATMFTELIETFYGTTTD